MFQHNINPVLLKIGSLQIRYYGLIFLLGFIIAYFMIYHLAKERKIKLSKDNVSDLIFYLIIGVVVGARVFYVLFYNLAYYITKPLEIFALWHGGLSFHGGLVGAMVAIYFFCKKYKLKFYDIVDIVVLPTALGLAFGRIGNFINGELYGRIANVPWAFDFGDGQPRHPSQLYESFKNFLIFGVLWFIRNKKLPKGFMFWSFVSMYGFLRFVVEFFREPDSQLGFIIFNLTMGQILSLSILVVGIVFLARLKK